MLLRLRPKRLQLVRQPRRGGGRSLPQRGERGWRRGERGWRRGVRRLDGGSAAGLARSCARRGRAARRRRGGLVRVRVGVGVGVRVGVRVRITVGVGVRARVTGGVGRGAELVDAVGVLVGQTPVTNLARVDELLVVVVEED